MGTPAGAGVGSGARRSEGVLLQRGGGAIVGAEVVPRGDEVWRRFRAAGSLGGHVPRAEAEEMAARLSALEQQAEWLEGERETLIAEVEQQAYALQAAENAAAAAQDALGQETKQHELRVKTMEQVLARVQAELETERLVRQQAEAVQKRAEAELQQVRLQESAKLTALQEELEAARLAAQTEQETAEREKDLLTRKLRGAQQAATHADELRKEAEASAAASVKAAEVSATKARSKARKTEKRAQEKDREAQQLLESAQQREQEVEAREGAVRQQQAKLDEAVKSFEDERKSLEMREEHLQKISSENLERYAESGHLEEALKTRQTALEQQEAEVRSKFAELEQQFATVSEAKTALEQQRAEMEVARDALSQQVAKSDKQVEEILHQQDVLEKQQTAMQELQRDMDAREAAAEQKEADLIAREKALAKKDGQLCKREALLQNLKMEEAQANRRVKEAMRLETEVQQRERQLLAELLKLESQPDPMEEVAKREQELMARIADREASLHEQAAFLAEKERKLMTELLQLEGSVDTEEVANSKKRRRVESHQDAHCPQGQPPSQPVDALSTPSRRRAWWSFLHGRRELAMEQPSTPQEDGDEHMHALPPIAEGTSERSMAADEPGTHEQSADKGTKRDGSRYQLRENAKHRQTSADVSYEAPAASDAEEHHTSAEVCAAPEADEQVAPDAQTMEPARDEHQADAPASASAVSVTVTTVVETTTTACQRPEDLHTQDMLVDSLPPLPTEQELELADIAAGMVEDAAAETPAASTGQHSPATPTGQLQAMATGFASSVFSTIFNRSPNIFPPSKLNDQPDTLDLQQQPSASNDAQPAATGDSHSEQTSQRSQRRSSRKAERQVQSVPTTPGSSRYNLRQKRGLSHK